MDKETKVKQENSNLRYDDFDLSKVGKIMWSGKYEIIRNVFIACVFAIIIAFLLPKTYRASAVLMPPNEGSNAGLLGSLSSLPFGNLVSQSSDETMTSMAILKSRTVMEHVVEKFNLIEVYSCKSSEEAVIYLRDNVSFNIEDEGTIKISTVATTSWFHPEDEEIFAKTLSADITNFFIEELNSVSKTLKTQKASFHRQFIEKRYNQNITDLKASEERLKDFQEKNNTIALPEQTESAIQVASAMMGEVLSNDVKIQVLTATFNADHPEIERLKKETEELKSQLIDLNYGTKSNTENGNYLFPAFSKVPKLGMDLMRLKRDVEVQNALFIYLTQQYEEAKIKEAKNTPTIQILDFAVPNDLKYKPSRVRILLLAAILSLIGSLYYLYFREKWRVLKGL